MFQKKRAKELAIEARQQQQQDEDVGDVTNDDMFQENEDTLLLGNHEPRMNCPKTPQ